MAPAGERHVYSAMARREVSSPAELRRFSRRPHSRPTCPGSSWLCALPLRTLRPLSCREHLPHEADQLPDGTEVCCGTGRDVLGATREVIVALRRRRPKLDHEGTLRGEGHTCVREARWPGDV